MLNSNLPVKTADGGDLTFNLVSNQGTTIVRRDSGSTRQRPRDLTIAHSETKAKGTGRITDRHLIQQQYVLQVGEGPGTGLITTNLTIAVDRDIAPEMVDEVVLDHVRQLCYLVLGTTFDSTDYTDNSFIEAILRGES